MRPVDLGLIAKDGGPAAFAGFQDGLVCKFNVPVDGLRYDKLWELLLDRLNSGGSGPSHGLCGRV